MELWTIQNEAVMAEIESDGVYRCHPSFSLPVLFGDDGELDPMFLACYHWMADRLEEKSPRPDGVAFPIWCWFRQWSSQNKKHPGKPDMRSWTTSEPEKVVRLRLEVDEERVLLSDFELWHIPLNFGYMGLSEQEDDEFDERCRKAGTETRDLPLYSGNDEHILGLKEEMLESWKLCLGLPDGGDFPSDWFGKVEEDAIQGVLWEIRREDIVSVEHFTTRVASKRI